MYGKVHIWDYSPGDFDRDGDVDTTDQVSFNAAGPTASNMPATVRRRGERITPRISTFTRWNVGREKVVENAEISDDTAAGISASAALENVNTSDSFPIRKA